MPQVDRLLKVRHSTELDTIEAAVQTLRKALPISVGRGVAGAPDEGAA